MFKMENFGQYHNRGMDEWIPLLCLLQRYPLLVLSLSKH